jgi:hypothetical protein
MVVRTFDEECAFIQQLDDTSYAIEKGFVENMRVPGHFYVNKEGPAAAHTSDLPVVLTCT